MIPARTLWMLAVLVLAVGCGRGDQPTIRRTPIASGEKAASSGTLLPSKGSDSGDVLSEAARKSRAPRATDASAASDQAPNPHAGDAPRSEGPDSASEDAVAKTSETVGKNALPANVAAAAQAGDSAAVRPASPDATDAANPRNASSAPRIGVQPSGDNGAAAAPADTRAPSPTKAAGQDDAKVADREVRFGGLRLTAPESWVREKPPTSFILAVFNLPGDKSAASNAQLTITLPVNNNPTSLNQLREQIQAEEQSEDTKVEHLKIAGHEIVLVDSTAEEEEESDDAKLIPTRYRTLNAMVFVDKSVFFVNCSGPEKTVAKRVGEFREFIKSMKSDN